MSTRTNIRPYPVITAGNMSGNITSTPTILQSVSMCSYSLSWSGTSPVGTAQVQCSNDYSLDSKGNVNNVGTWTTLTLNVSGTPGTTIPITGNTGTAFIDIDQIGSYAIRLVYTAVSGSGTLIAVFNGKVS